MKRRHFAGAALLLPIASAVRAQTPAWPQRPVKFIVPNAPGSSIDTIARILSTQMAQGLTQPLVVDN